MPEILDVQFGGLSGLVHPNRVPFDQSIIATDCFLDDDTISGRTGYRSATQLPIDATGTPQLLGRFQPDITQNAHYVVVISGDVWLVSEPSSVLLSDATSTKIGSGIFLSTDNISGAQLGTNFYLATDNVVPKWVRITSALAIEVLQQLPMPPLPNKSPGTLAFVSFPAQPTHWSVTGGATLSTLSPPWTGINGNPGDTATVDITLGVSGAFLNLQNTKWLLVACSPMTQSAGGGQFSVSLGNTGTYVTVQTIYDTPGGDSPFVVYLLLDGVDKNVLLHVDAIRFTQVGPAAGYFAVLGYMVINTPPEPGTVSYYVTYFNSVTGAESTLSPVTNVVYNNSGVTFPTYHAGRWHFGAFADAGTASTNPETLTTNANFNAGSGLQSPAASDFSPVYTFSGTIDVGARFPNADTVRLYRSTPNGISLVGSSVYSTDGSAANAKRADGSAWTTGTGTVSDLPTNVTYWQAAGTTWSITDSTGMSASANAIYQPGGPGPRTITMAGYAGRLVAAYGNRLYISSFTPVTAASNLIPEWPPIAVQDANGWSFDIDPSPTEQILSVVSGDGLYICTNTRVLVLRSLTPGTVPFEIFARGVIGRQAAIYVEEQLIWAAYDGVYSAQNVSQTAELSQAIRIYVYQNQFQPDSTVVLGYQVRKLHVFKGKQRLRYDFVTRKWTGPDTLANGIFSAMSFSGVINSTLTLVERLWALTSDLFIARFQPYCFLDNQIDQGKGTPPPPWKYSTGFSRTVKPGFVDELSVLASGVVTAKVSKTVEGLETEEARTLAANDQLWRTEVDFSGPSDLRGKKFRVEFSGTNLVTLYTAHLMREEIDARGG